MVAICNIPDYRRRLWRTWHASNHRVGRANNLAWCTGTCDFKGRVSTGSSRDPSFTADAPRNRVADPRFVNYASNDFHLSSSDGVARDGGVTLSYFSTDKDGVTRPQGTAWDIGPYEFRFSAPNPPAAPTNLRIIVQ